MTDPYKRWEDRQEWEEEARWKWDEEDEYDEDKIDIPYDPDTMNDIERDENVRAKSL